MKILLSIAMGLSLCLLGTAAAQVLSWQDSGAYYEATLKGFREGLRSEGFVEGKNLELMQRSASNDPELRLAHRTYRVRAARSRGGVELAVANTREHCTGACARKHR